MKIKKSDILVAVMVLAVILLIIVPLSPDLLDIFLITNITLSLLILLTTLFTKKTLEFSTFPTVLLIVTLFRLALNIASTRLILGNGGDAGHVIQAFGQFVVGGNLVVGLVIFLIIVAVQFIVITKGAERVSEVAARFTLDAMPGKQMAIDADLSAGNINEDQARERRQDIQREADFYGAMDGASKFVKGDAIIGIIITVINIVGGIIVGLLGTSGKSMTFDQVIQVYTLATVGDGLCSQIPALLVSTATGIIVTRAATKEGFGQDVSRQMFGNPSTLYVLGAMLALISLIPGLPKLPMLALAIILPIIGYTKSSKAKKAEAAEQKDVAETSAAEKRKPESVTSLLHVDLIEMEFGYGLISLVDTTQGGDLLDRVVMIRRQCALDLGIIVPIVRLRDNIQLGTREYVIKIKGYEVAKGEVMLGHYLALKPEDVDEPIDGIETVEPTFGLPALWIAEADREKAELKGYTTIDVPSVISTHLMEVIKRHADELLGRQQVQTIIDKPQKAAACAGGRGGAQDVLCRRGAEGALEPAARGRVHSRHRLDSGDTRRLRQSDARYRCADGIRPAETEARHHQELYSGRPGAGHHHQPGSRKGAVRQSATGGQGRGCRDGAGADAAVFSEHEEGRGSFPEPGNLADGDHLADWSASRSRACRPRCFRNWWCSRTTSWSPMSKSSRIGR